MGFGKQLERVLFEKAMSVSQLSKQTGIPASTLYSIIDRDTNSVGIDKVKKIERAVCATPGGIIYNLLYGIEPGNEEVSTRQHDFYSMDPHSRGYRLEEKYELLNIKGQAKVFEYVEDLTKIPEYRKQQPDTSEEPAAPDLLAAHARTDVEQTPEGIQHDLDIMNDDSMWK